MYLAHYGLRAKPFSISPDSKFIWLGEKHKEALATLEYGIREEKGFLLLTGDVGTGKTVLINTLIDHIDLAVVVARIPDPDLETIDFFNLLSEEFGINEHFESKGAFLIRLKEFLTAAHVSEKSVLLIIDEAQRLSHTILEQIRLLSNIELHDKKLINIFFVGQSEFNAQLGLEKNKAVRQRIAVSYHIAPLTEPETTRYILHRLKVAGAAREFFTPRALKRIFTFSHGNPRLINIICDRALLTGYAAGIQTLDDKIIQECENELQIRPSTPKSPAKKSDIVTATQDPIMSPAPTGPSRSQNVGMAIGLMILLILAGYYAYERLLESPNQWAIEDIAPQQNRRLLTEEKKVAAFKLKKKESAAQNQDVERSTPQKLSELNEIVQHSWQKIENQFDPLKPAFQDGPLPAGKVIIYFELNSNALSEQAYEKLDRVVDYISNHPDSQIIIEGYTDSYGDYAYNKNLSKYRADMIKSYFAGLGIASSQIQAIGRGPENPIASNTTLAGRKKNRRVEVRVKRHE